MATKKTKVVDWNKELSKATGKYVLAIDKLFKDYEKYENRRHQESLRETRLQAEAPAKRQGGLHHPPRQAHVDLRLLRRGIQENVSVRND